MKRSDNVPPRIDAIRADAVLLSTDGVASTDVVSLTDRLSLTDAMSLTDTMSFGGDVVDGPCDIEER